MLTDLGLMLVMRLLLVAATTVRYKFCDTKSPAQLGMSFDS
jgi:hypothetical protein